MRHSITISNTSSESKFIINAARMKKHRAELEPPFRQDLTITKPTALSGHHNQPGVTMYIQCK